jgi:hypothetical protein
MKQDRGIWGDMKQDRNLWSEIKEGVAFVTLLALAVALGNVATHFILISIKGLI